MTKQFCTAFAVALAALTFHAGPALAQEAVKKPAVVTRIETETILVTRAAAFPSEITRKPGLFFLELKTQIPDRELNLVWVPAVEAADGSKLARGLDLPGLRKRKRSAGLIDLPPGVYYLQLQRSGKTICTLTIGK